MRILERNLIQGSHKIKTMDVSESFPSGLRVMVVDDDPICLLILEKMLKECRYQVTPCSCATEAYTILQESKDTFDLVICDVYMPDMDGFKLLELIGLEMDLPVIMMSGNGDTSLVMKGITHGACDYLLKPIRVQELRNIWQHVLRKRPDFDINSVTYSFERNLRKSFGDVKSKDSVLKKRKVKLELSGDAEESYNNLKKARVVWTSELHRKFVVAVNQLGIDKAGPKSILETMKVRGLSRENVASHLQKYRLGLKRLYGIEVQHVPIASFQASENGKFGGKMHVQPGCPKCPLPGSEFSIRSSVGVFGRSLDELDYGTLTALAQVQAAQKRLSCVNQTKGVVHSVEGVTHDLISSKIAQMDNSLIDLQEISPMELDVVMPLHQGATKSQSKEFPNENSIDFTRMESEIVAGSGEKTMHEYSREGQQKDLMSNIVHGKVEQATSFNAYVEPEAHWFDFDLSNSSGGFEESTSLQRVHHWGAINQSESDTFDSSKYPCKEISNYVQFSPHCFSSLLDEFLPP